MIDWNVLDDAKPVAAIMAGSEWIMLTLDIGNKVSNGIHWLIGNETPIDTVCVINT